MNELKDTLWKAADKLRGSMDASQYKNVVLGLVFLAANAKGRGEQSVGQLIDEANRQIMRTNPTLDKTLLLVFNQESVDQRRLGELLDLLDNTRFSGRIEAIRDAVEAGLAENRFLAELRDALLPQLMSGRLRVKDAEKQVEAVV